MKHRILTAAIAALVALVPAGRDRLSAQDTGPVDALRRDVGRRFDVLPLQNGVALRPRDGGARVRSIEVTDGTIAIDGAPVTGAELRARLGADAELVLRVSYLDAAARQQLAGQTGAAPPARPDGAVAAPAEREGDERPRDDGSRRRRSRDRDNGNDRVRFGGNVSVEEGEAVSGNAVAIGGSVRVNGEVDGDAVAVGGSVELGPHAVVTGDAVVIGGSLKRDPGAVVNGKVVDVGNGLNFDFGNWRWNRLPFGAFQPFGLPFFGAAIGVIALMGTLMRVLVLSALTSIVLFAGRDFVEQVGARAAAEPLKAGIVGLLAQMLFGPLIILTIVVFVITIIGIPLLLLIPFAILAFGVVMLIGFTAVAYNLGRLANTRFAWAHDNPYLTAITGILLLVSPLLIARILGLADWILFPITGTLVFLGLVAEYLAWTVGFGAVALQRFGGSQPSAVPPPAAQGLQTI